MYQNDLKYPIRFEEDDEPKENPLENLTAAAFAPFNKKFLEQRKIFFWGVVHDNSAKELVNKLLYLE
ncbi:MAG: ATP-dependent Clp protease proteolytic subunit, partial [Bacteroidota bacterium]